MNCRVCNGKTIKIFSSDKCIKSSHTFAKKLVPETESFGQITISRCLECGLVQTLENFEEDYSNDYQRNTSFSQSAIDFMNQNITEFEKAMNGLKSKKIVEIGCGDGFFANLIQKKGAKVLGYEPSRAAAKLATEKNINTINSYFESTTKPTELQDGFCLRYVLEHIPRPVELLREIGSSLVDDAYGLIELPNYEKMVQTKRYYEFFREHVSYFSANSLVRALELSGFELLRYYNVMNSEYLVAIVRKKNPQRESESFAKSKEEINSALSKMVYEEVLQGKRVAFYGASGGGVSLVSYAGINQEDIQCFFDTDPNKHGFYTYGTSLPIIEPTKEKIQNMDAIIILSTTYEDEIVKSLKEKYGFKGRLGSVRELPHWKNG